MGNILNNLIGAKVVGAEEEHGGLYLAFEGGRHLAIYNRHHHSSGAGSPSLIESVLADIQSDNETLLLVFSNGQRVIVDMNETGYVRPEAMQFKSTGGVIIVWP